MAMFANGHYIAMEAKMESIIKFLLIGLIVYGIGAIAGIFPTAPIDFLIAITSKILLG